jgi:hypothetical protein
MFEGIADKIWVLSLPGDAERRARLPGHLAEFGITDFAWHDAHGPDAPEVKTLFAEDQVARFPSCFRCGKLRCADDTCNNVLIPTQVANFASYLSLWRKIAAEPQVALIIEDDILFHPWAKRSAAFLRRKIARGRLPLRADVPFMLRIAWGLDDDHKWRPFSRLRDKLRMSNPGHLMTSAFAAALLERFERIETTSDVFLHREAPRAGETLTLFPPMATELSYTLGQLDSTIHPKEVYLDHLEAEGRTEEHAAHVERLRTHIKHIYHRPLMITGHPRSGTKFAATVCSQLGVDVGHETDGVDGISSWMFAVEADENPWARHPAARTRRAFHWHHMIQCVRDPATAVPSIMRENAHAPASYDFRRDHILRGTGTDLDSFKTEAERALASLCLWNKIIRAQSPAFTFRIEADAGALQDFLTASGFELDQEAELDLTPANANKRYKGQTYDKPEMAPGDWTSLSAPAAALLDDYCETYDYPNPGRA